MAVPDYQSLMLPMLETLADGLVRRVVPDVSSILATRFHLTRDDHEQMLPSGAMPTFINRTHWAATYMSKAGWWSAPRTGISASPSAPSTCWRQMRPGARGPLP
jgi:restriction system protein